MTDLWDFGEEGKSIKSPTPPAKFTADAMTLLLSYEPNVQVGEQQGRRQALLQITRTVVRFDWIAPLFRVRPAGPSDIGQAPDPGGVAMTDPKIIADDENRNEEALKAILRNPNLAEEAFPDKKIRENVIQLFTKSSSENRKTK